MNVYVPMWIIQGFEVVLFVFTVVFGLVLLLWLIAMSPVHDPVQKAKTGKAAGDPCTECGGNGVQYGRDCLRCHGTGVEE